MTITNWILTNAMWMVFGVTLLMLGYYIKKLFELKKKRRRPISVLEITLQIWALLFLIFIVSMGSKLQPADWVQVILLGGLVTVTAVYTTASVNMAKEMREQRYDVVRPVIDIYRDQADDDKIIEALDARDENASRGLSCVLKNIGLGPAIDVYSFIQNPFSGEHQRHEFGTLAIGEPTFRRKLSLIHEGSPLALIAYYRDVYGRTFVSIREVSSDKEKGWEIGPLQSRPVTQEEHL